MILGQTVELTLDAQVVVARWAAKTAVMFHYAYPALAAVLHLGFSKFAVDPSLPRMFVSGSQQRRVRFSPQSTKSKA
jgi:hypothetical protein